MISPKVGSANTDTLSRSTHHHQTTNHAVGGDKSRLLYALLDAGNTTLTWLSPTCRKESSRLLTSDAYVTIRPRWLLSHSHSHHPPQYADHCPLHLDTVHHLRRIHAQQPSTVFNQVSAAVSYILPYMHTQELKCAVVLPFSRFALNSRKRCQRSIPSHRSRHLGPCSCLSIRHARPCSDIRAVCSFG